MPDTMTVANKMDSYAARLASFNTAHPTTRKRASNAQGAKTLKWPHKQPSPPQVYRSPQGVGTRPPLTVLSLLELDSSTGLLLRALTIRRAICAIVA